MVFRSPPPNAEPRFSLSHLIEKLPKDTYDILEEISYRKNPLLDNNACADGIGEWPGGFLRQSFAACTHDLKKNMLRNGT